MQSCPELAGEAVDYLESSNADSLEAPPSQLVILAVDETPDADHLEHLKSALSEVRSRQADINTALQRSLCCFGLTGLSWEK